MMPIYEYTCSRCRARYEKIMKYDSSGHSTCPECKGVGIKVPSSFSIRGIWRQYDWGKHSKLIFYPDGRKRIKSHNKSYADGGI